MEDISIGISLIFKWYDSERTGHNCLEDKIENNEETGRLVADLELWVEASSFQFLIQESKISVTLIAMSEIIHLLDFYKLLGNTKHLMIVGGMTDFRYRVAPRSISSSKDII